MRHIEVCFQPWYNHLWLTGLNAPSNERTVWANDDEEENKTVVAKKFQDEWTSFQFFTKKVVWSTGVRINFLNYY